MTGRSEAIAKIDKVRDKVLACIESIHVMDYAAELHDWEYVPGHKWTDRDGVEHWFVQSGTIAPGRVAEYIAEGGEVIRRRVGKWEVVA